jgi:hypothetical protein
MSTFSKRAVILQRVSNSSAVALVFLAVCSPRFVPEVYEDIDDEGKPA